jgi:hypothetical protein
VRILIVYGSSTFQGVKKLNNKQTNKKKGERERERETDALFYINF